eukprot:Phypoly_transcript_15332.p1 GENE.Phypoly_transcript_15332~~Phypoly_transcript_15332.p1  ORF type:complete len:259 (+),score=40.09 Phypoly_transcript_15332:121-897(+)
MSDILQEAEVIKGGIANLKNNIKALQAQHKQALFALTPEQTNKISADIQKLTEDTTALIHKVNNQIDTLKKSADADGNTMRQNLAAALSGKFGEALRQYQEAQNEYTEKVKAKMVQKVKIVQPQATETQIEKAIETGQVDKMFVQSTLDGAQLAGQAKNALSYVKDRHRDIVAIEASVRELNQLFIDFAIIVNSSGEMLGHIEENVNSAVLHTASGAQELGKAVKEQKKSRKKMYIILFILVIIVIIVLFSTLLGIFH